MSNLEYGQLLSELNTSSNQIIHDIPDLCYIGDPVLRTDTQDVSLEEGKVIGDKLLIALEQYRKNTGLGVGLAATQIGITANVFVTYLSSTPKIYINPKIHSYSDSKNLFKENCLSSSHVWCDVERPQEIDISYMDEKGEMHTEHYAGSPARVLQHEYDHLRGIVNVDRALQGTIEYRFGDPKVQKIRE